MNEEKSNKSKKSYLKWMIALLVIILLLGGLRLMLKSDWLLDYARGTIVEQANEQLNGELQIGAIRGDLLFGITISDVKLNDLEQNEILAIDTVQLRYTLLSLIRKPYRLDLLRIDGLRGTLVQHEDSVWNVERLLIPPDQEEEPEESDPLYWSVDRILVDRANISVRSDILLPDGYLEVEDLSIQSFAEVFPERWMVSLNHLSLTLKEGRLPSPVEFSMQAVAMDRQITLESLVINTGRSLLEMEAEIVDEEEISSHAELAPISRQDIAAYLDEYPVQKDISIGLRAEGTLENLMLSLTADAGTGGRFSISVGSDIRDPYLLTKIDFEMNNFNGPELLGDSTLPLMDYAEFTGTGSVNLMEPENADWDGTLKVESLAVEGFSVDHLDFNYSIADQIVGLNGSIQKQGEHIRLDGRAESVFGDRPTWRASIDTKNMNLATWLQDDDLDSRLTISVDADGSGYAPSEITSNLNVVVSEGRFGDQEFSGLRFDGNVDPQRISGDFLATIDRSRFTADFIVNEWRKEIPYYEFKSGLHEVNLAEFSGLEELRTFLNGTLSGEGRSFDFETLVLNASVEIDSSLVNGEPIDLLKADFKIENQTLFIDDGILESAIADADFSLRQHLAEFTHSQNRLEFEAVVKDLFAIAPLLGVENLAAEGRLNGLLERNTDDDVLEFNGDLVLENIFVDTLFTADNITGNVNVLLFEDIQVQSRLDIARPDVMGQTIQDFIMTATAEITEDETLGNVGFELINDEESRIVHSGQYSISEARSLLTTRQLDFITPEGIFSLQRNFDISFADDVLSVDTLRIQTLDEESYVELWAPHIDTLSQRIGLDARDLNLGVLQRTLIGEEVMNGFLSGYIHIHNSADSLSLNATGLLSSIEYEDGKMDSLRFSGSVEKEWLELLVTATHENEELLTSTARVPFIVGDPATFDDQFFDREVEAQFNLNSSDINYWLSFVPGQPVEQTSGFISYTGNLSGTAGNPEYTGDIKLNEGQLSGVLVDSLTMNMMYDHDMEEIGFSGELVSRGVQVLSFNNRMPFKIDLRELELLLPSDEDSLNIELETRDFNLAVFNDFVDREHFRQIAGRLNGKVNVTGTLGDLRPQGTLALTNGSMRVVQAGITISNIASRINLSPDLVELQQFTMQSGPGRLRAVGSVGLESLVPVDIDIDIRGTQFRILNTPEYSAIVDLNSNITGTFEEPSLNGSLTFLRGFVNLDNFGERAVEDVVLEDEDEVEPMEFYDAMEIEMDVNFTRQFFIRNSQYLDLEIELGGQVDLLKRRYDDLEMFGQLEGVRGFARPLGKEFIIENAFVTFYGPIDNPELDVTTKFEPPQSRAEVTIYYIIEGTTQEPEFRFESDPQMELQDIFSYTIFGRPFYELESWEQAVAGGGSGPTIADVALEVVLDRVEMLAAQRLGIDVVQIENSRTGSNSNTSILTGWYLNRRTFFALINEVSASPKTLFLLEYLLTENLELIITQGDDSREGVDLRWKYDY